MVKFESVYDKNFTNQSAPILSFSFVFPSGRIYSQTAAPPRLSLATALNYITICHMMCNGGGRSPFSITEMSGSLRRLQHLVSPWAKGDE